MRMPKGARKDGRSDYEESQRRLTPVVGEAREVGVGHVDLGGEGLGAQSRCFTVSSLTVRKREGWKTPGREVHRRRWLVLVSVRI